MWLVGLVCWLVQYGLVNEECNDSFVCFGEVIMDGIEGDEDVVSDVTEI